MIDRNEKKMSAKRQKTRKRTKRRSRRRIKRSREWKSARRKLICFNRLRTFK